jgi:adenosylcobinamide kinase/adenosylcobinamide-phosphate guanylyltransferase
MGKLTLFLGGARSGKSTQAEKLAAQRGERVLYVATALPFDDEMRLRIENHRKTRPDTWKTIEAPTGIAEALQGAIQSVDVVLLDCLTLLVNNLFMALSGDPDHPDQGQYSEALHREIDTILATIESSTAEWIIVSNEVGFGLVPPYPLGRVYRDLLGWANQRIAVQADEIYLMVAGMAIPLHQVALKL